jgi:hypothetical protein
MKILMFKRRSMMQIKTFKKVLILIVCLFLCSIGTAMSQEIDYCEADFDFDADVDAGDVSKFLEDFSRTKFNNPCPFVGPAPVSKTGQMEQFAPGDDGHWSKGVDWPVARFIDVGDGTVRDRLTGLIWLKDANCFGLKLWGQAVLDSNGLEDGLCGLTDDSSGGDWRLPNVNELLSMVDRSQDSPALPVDHLFTNVQSSFYWSSTTAKYNTAYAWYVYIGDGYSDFDDKATVTSYVWPVRGGK